jgi:anti-anti-sigma factor
MDKSLKTLLLSSDSSDVLNGLEQVDRKNFYTNLPYIIEIIKKNDRAISKKASHMAAEITEVILKDHVHEIKPEAQDILSKLLLHLEPDILNRIFHDFRSGQQDDKLDALYLLGSLKHDKLAAQLLQEALNDNNRLIRSCAVKMLGRIAESRAPGIIARFLKDTDSRVRANAVEALENTANKNIVGILLKIRSDVNNRVKGNVLKALWHFGYKDILGDLRSMLEDDSELMRASGCWVIGEIGPGHPEVEELLDIVSVDTSKLVSTNVLVAKSKIHPDAEGQVGIQTGPSIKDKIIRESAVAIEQTRTRYFTVFQIKGRLNVYSMLPLKLKLQELLKAEGVNVALDFEQVEDVDSPVVHFLINLNKKIRSISGKFMIYNVRQNIMEIFNMANLDSTVLVFSRDETVGHLLN